MDEGGWLRGELEAARPAWRREARRPRSENRVAAGSVRRLAGDLGERCLAIRFANLSQAFRFWYLLLSVS